jgi:hypothetical protein
MQSVGGIPNRTAVCATVNPIGMPAFCQFTATLLAEGRRPVPIPDVVPVLPVLLDVVPVLPELPDVVPVLPVPPDVVPTTTGLLDGVSVA